MLVMERLIGSGPELDSFIRDKVGPTRWEHLLWDLASVPAVTLPDGWELMDGGKVEPRAQADDYEALMQPAGPRGGRLPR